ncbi:Hypothetical predicted protein [Podarcis lilfordi]|uniref:Uncharacterized protein n=1 Tax=Podarcis lilfordi TaxID=74358 RepID=A0AA35L613_9SAUR|nr:Hypothetical predicted protein [Podarcis lilfordi]
MNRRKSSRSVFRWNRKDLKMATATRYSLPYEQIWEDPKVHGEEWRQTIRMRVSDSARRREQKNFVLRVQHRCEEEKEEKEMTSDKSDQLQVRECATGCYDVWPPGGN